MIRNATNVVRLEPRLPRPSIKERFRVVIAGGGFGGVALAAHVVRAGDSRLEITLLTECQSVGRGTAGTIEVDGLELPDVRAADLSLFDDEPDDFVHWLRRHGIECSRQDSVDGRFLDAWLEDKLLETSQRAAQADMPLTVRAATRITDLMQREDTCLVGLDDGTSIRCDAVVLAAGDASAGDALAARDLEQRLTLRGMCMPDPLGCGWATGPHRAAIGADGRTRRLYVLGPARRQGRRSGRAIPKLRHQAAELASELIRSSAIADRARRLARARSPFAPVV